MSALSTPCLQLCHSLLHHPYLRQHSQCNTLLSVTSMYYNFCSSQIDNSLFHGAVVMTDIRLSVNLYLRNAARPTAAIVSGNHNRVAPRAIFVTKSPRCGGTSKWSSSPVKSYFCFLPPASQGVSSTAVAVCRPVSCCCASRVAAAYLTFAFPDQLNRSLCLCL